jgi:hypothetical protein
MIHFWFSIGSTYTYPSVMRLAEVERASGVTFRWRPFSVRQIMDEQNNRPFITKPVKMAYMWRDIERRRDVPAAHQSTGALLMDHSLKTIILSISILLLLTSPAFANKIEATIWLFSEAWMLGIFAGFLGFNVFVPLKKLMLGASYSQWDERFFLIYLQWVRKKVTTGSANVDFTGAAKLNFKDAPRYAVLVADLLIVAAALW